MLVIYFLNNFYHFWNFKLIFLLVLSLIQSLYSFSLIRYILDLLILFSKPLSFAHIFNVFIFPTTFNHFQAYYFSALLCLFFCISHPHPHSIFHISLDEYMHIEFGEWLISLQTSNKFFQGYYGINQHVIIS